MEQFMQRLAGLISDKGKQNGSSFLPRRSDVIIVCPIKCGTTWTKQIVHQLRSGGDMGFEDIDDIIPWIDMSYDTELDLNAEQKYDPRCFANHTCYDDTPKGAKYIVLYREPCASFYSSFNFFQGRYFQPEEITLDEYVKHVHLSGLPIGNYFDHLLSWWPHRNDPNVLFLLYEDMLEDLETSVRQVSSLIGISSKERIATAVEMSKFDFMKKNQDKFLCHRISHYRNKVIGLDENILLPRVATGSATKGREMMGESTKDAVLMAWNEKITKQLGFKNYEELRNALKTEKK